jgi:hypothetical protein
LSFFASFRAGLQDFRIGLPSFRAGLRGLETGLRKKSSIHAQKRAVGGGKGEGKPSPIRGLITSTRSTDF